MLQIRLNLFGARVEGRRGVQQVSVAVEQVVGASARHGVGVAACVEVLQADVESRNVFGASYCGGKRYDLPAGDGVGVGVGVGRSAGVAHGVLVPLSSGVIVGIVAFPGVCGNDGSVDNDVGVDDVLAEGFGHVVGEFVKPCAQLFLGCAVVKKIVEVGAPQP